MNNMLGKKLMISGMMIEIVADEGDSWKARNTTTNATVMFKKSVIEKAIKLGKAEEYTDINKK